MLRGEGLLGGGGGGGLLGVEGGEGLLGVEGGGIAGGGGGGGGGGDCWVLRERLVEFSFVLTNVQEMQAQTRQAIEDYPLPTGQGAWQSCLHNLVLGYLVHHGYCDTAAAFAKTTSQTLEEDWVSISNRQSQYFVCHGRCCNVVCLPSRNPGLCAARANQRGPQVGEKSIPWDSGQ